MVVCVCGCVCVFVWVGDDLLVDGISAACCSIPSDDFCRDLVFLAVTVVDEVAGLMPGPARVALGSENSSESNGRPWGLLMPSSARQPLGRRIPLPPAKVP